MSNQQDQLPKGWEIKKLGEVSDILNGGTPKTNIAQYWDGEIHWITPADLGKLTKPTTADTPRKISRFGLEKSSAKLFPENSVILSTRAPIGHLAINEVPMCTNQGCRGIVPSKKLDTWFLYYFLKMNVEYLDSLGTGTTFKELSTKALAGVEIPLPSLPEQQRIVSILDEAFAAIAKAKANAEQNLKNAKELFESYLQGVFENGDWEKKELRELTTILGDGLHGTPEYTSNGEYYFINGNNLHDGTIVFKDTTKRVNIDEFNKHKKNLNDRTILVSINGTLANVAFYNNEKIILGKSACYFNLKESVDKRFVKYVLSSPYFIKYAHKEATGATIKNVSLKSMREFKVPFPTIKQQQTIVQKFDALRTETQKLEAVYKKKIEDLEELKKSLLQKAFSGEL